MKHGLAKTGIICLVLVIALGSLGVAFAYWTETLPINARVHTGELAAGLRWYHAIEKDPYVKVTPRVVYWHPPGVHEHTFYLSGAYPSYGSGCWGDQQFFCATYFMTNMGTIPVKVQSITITRPDWIEVWTWGSQIPQEVKEEMIAEIQTSTDIPEDEKPGMIAAVEDDWEVGQVIYPREHGIAHTWACIGIRLHILDTAPENGLGTITVETIFSQFNTPLP